eukprot:19560-Heterococcus_DN1.PRE.2
MRGARYPAIGSRENATNGNASCISSGVCRSTLRSLPVSFAGSSSCFCFSARIVLKFVHSIFEPVIKGCSQALALHAARVGHNGNDVLQQPVLDV